MNLEGLSLGWGSCAEPHLVRWVIVCLDERKSGLGIRCFLALLL